MNLFRSLALVCLSAAACFAQANTSIVATQVRTSGGGLLANGNYCLTPSSPPTGTGVTSSAQYCASVMNGVAGTLAVPNASTVTTPYDLTYTVTVTDAAQSGATVLTVPNVQIAGASFNWSIYVIPSSAKISGIGIPFVACNAGGQYTQTDATGTNLWVCTALNGTSTWYLAPPQIIGNAQSSGGGGTGNVGSGGGTLTQVSVNLTFGTIPDGGCVDKSFTFTGTSSATPVYPTWPASLPSGLSGIMYPTATNTVNARLCNLSGASVTLGSTIFGASIGGGGSGTGTVGNGTYQGIISNFLGLNGGPGAATDAGISRPNANIFDFGNGTFGDTSASIYAGHFYGDGSNLTGVSGGSAGVLTMPGATATPTVSAVLNSEGIYASQYSVSASSSDNYTNLQAALNAAASTGKGNVYLDAGTFLTCSTLVIPTKVNLWGAGRGDAGGPNTTIKACPTFTNGTFVFNEGLAGSPVFGAGIHRMNIDMGESSTNLKNLGAIAASDIEEQTHNSDLMFSNFSGYGVFYLGADYGPSGQQGKLQNAGPDENWESYPNTAATSGTRMFVCLNCQEYRGLDGFTFYGESGTSKPDHAIEFSGNASTIRHGHIEGTNLAAIALGLTGTAGAIGINVEDVQCTIQCSGNNVELYTNAFNSPSGNHFTDVTASAACGVKDDLTGACDGYWYFVGQQSGGTRNTIASSSGTNWLIYSTVNFFKEPVFQSTGCQLDIKYGGGSFPGWPLCVGADGSLVMGNGSSESAGSLKIYNSAGWGMFLGDNSNNAGGLVIQPAIADAYANTNDAITYNAFYNFNGHSWQNIGDNSHEMAGIRFTNASLIGGIDFWDAVGVAENTAYTTAQIESYSQLRITSQYLRVPLRSSDPAGAYPAAGYGGLYWKLISGVPTPCVIDSTGTVTCGSTGGGGGGGSGITLSATGNGVDCSGTSVAVCAPTEKVPTAASPIIDSEGRQYLNFTGGTNIGIGQAGLSGNLIAGWYTDVCNASSSSINLVASVSTFNGSSSTISIGANHHVRIVSDGTNFKAEGGDTCTGTSF